MAGQFTLGGVLRRAKAITRRHPVGYAVTALLVVFVPSLWGYLLSDSIESLIIPDDAASATVDLLQTLTGFVSDILCGIGALLLAGIVIQASVAEARGAPVPFSASLRVGLVRFLPNLGIAAVTGLVVVLAGAILVIPGLMILTAWSVAIPVATVERCRFGDLFRRSAALTGGDQWRLFGLIVPGFAIYAATDLLQNTVIDRLDLEGVAMWTLGVAGALLQAMLAVFGGACWAAAYLELRRTKEGVFSEVTLAAFD